MSIFRSFSLVLEEAVVGRLVVDMVASRVLEIEDVLFEVGKPVSDKISSSLSDGSSDPLDLLGGGQVYGIVDIESFRKSCPGERYNLFACRGGFHGPQWICE